MEQQLLSPQALATMLGMAVQTIYNRYSVGGDLPPAIKLGRLLRFQLEDVQVWLNKKKAAVAVTSVQTNVVVTKRRPGRPTKAEQIAARKSQ